MSKAFLMPLFLFGFDTVVISDAEETIQSLWQLSPTTHGWAISMALWGTVLGSMVGGIPTERIGRKPTLIAIGILYFTSAIWSAVATDIYSFMVASDRSTGVTGNRNVE